MPNWPKLLKKCPEVLKSQVSREYPVLKKHRIARTCLHECFAWYPRVFCICRCLTMHNPLGLLLSFFVELNIVLTGLHLPSDIGLLHYILEESSRVTTQDPHMLGLRVRNQWVNVLVT